MPLDAMVLTALCAERSAPLTGARIDRISMPEKDLLILSVHTKEDGNRKLLLSFRPGAARIHFTARSPENPTQPPMFCMLLRKYLLGARIRNLEQPEGERLVLIRLDASDELHFHSEKTLAVELMGKGLNLLLIGEDGRIVDCLRRVDYDDGARRALLPGLFYTLPPAQDKPSFLRTDADTFARMTASAPREKSPDRWLLDAFGGLSPLLCRELALDGWKGLEERADRLRQRIAERRFEPVMLLENGRPKDFSFLPIRQYADRWESRTYPDFSTLLEEFYSRRDLEESMRRRASELSRTVKSAHARLLRKLAAREQELSETENRETYRRRGDLITANIYRLKRGMASFEAQDYYEENCPTVTVPLDVRKTPQQNAAYNYKLYSKAKTAARMLTGLIETAQEETAYLESVLDELERAENERDLQDVRAELIAGGYLRSDQRRRREKRPAERKPMRFVSDSGREIFAGRGNVQNDELTFRLARRTDLWLHVQKIPGSHVIVSQSEGEADEQTIRQAAAIAVTLSRTAEGDRAAVDCTLVRNVKKPSGARPGRVIYTDYRTLAAQSDPGLVDRLRKE